MKDILLSRIAANPTETSWAQSYSTHNFYIAMSVSSSALSEPITVTGRDIFDRLTRQFFALEEKNLSNIKEAMHNVNDSLKPDLSFSLVLGTIVEDVLYIVIVNKGLAFIHRRNRLGIIGEGEEGKIVGFSGHLANQDVIILATEGFVQKITPGHIASYVETEDIAEIADQINPQLHEHAKGDEAALILQYSAPDTESADSHVTTEPPTSNDSVEIEQPEPKQYQPQEVNNPPLTLDASKKTRSLPKLHINRKTIIVGVILLLITTLVFMIVQDNRKKETAQNQKVLQEILEPARKDYEDALALEGLNKPIALENLKNSQARLLAGKNKLPVGSPEIQQLDELLNQVNNQIAELEGAAQVKNTVLLEASTQKDLKEIAFLSLADGKIIIAGKNGKAAEVSTSGTVKKFFDVEEDSIAAVAHDNSYLYFATGGSIYRVDQGNGSVKEIVSDTAENSDIADLVAYSSNLYLLNSSDKSVTKYSGSSYASSDYFTDDTTISGAPLSLAIDNSVWIIEESGTISKFSRGEKDDFSSKGVPGSFGKNSLLHTDVDYSNLYILDRDKNRLVVIGKDGIFKSQFQSPEFQKADSFAVDEQNKKAYYISNNKLLVINI